MANGVIIPPKTEIKRTTIPNVAMSADGVAILPSTYNSYNILTACQSNGVGIPVGVNGTGWALYAPVYGGATLNIIITYIDQPV